MGKADEFIGVSATSAVQSLGGEAATGGRTGKAPIVELLVVGLLAMILVPTLILAARQQVTAEQAKVTMSISSDPTDAAVIVDNLLVGRTPMDFELERGETVSLRVEAREPYLEYDLYKPYRTELTVEEGRSLDVWIPRTSAEEQAAQRAGSR